VTEVQIQRRGRGAAIKLPKEFLAELELKNGDFVNLTVKDGKCILEPVIAAKEPDGAPQSDAS
jgi:antitoxin component of MazEF toxin-antitoxin module